MIWVPKIQRTVHTLSFELLSIMKKSLFLVTLAISVLAACRKETNVDTIVPTVVGVTINGLDSAVFVTSAGSVFQVHMEVADNNELNEVRLAVHEAVNGHSHEGSGHTGGEFHLNSGEWAKDDVLQTSGLEATIDVEVSVPDTIAGNWHLVITVMDKLGNVSEEHTVLIQVTNDELPQIVGSTDPAADGTGTIHLASGTSISLDGTITDSDSLAQVNSYIMTMGGQVGVLVPIEMTGTPESLTFLDLIYSDFPTGTYWIVIEAIDTEGHRRLWDNRIIVQ